MTRPRKLRVGDPVPPDAVEFIRAVRALPPETRQSFTNCILTLPPNLSPYDRMVRVLMALGVSKHRAVARARPLRRKHLSVVPRG